ncbi:MAG: hypothetical protein K1000chlam2_01507 [Chlamydiae bacterium]|nr:hypothetical protein [Chlamydiota bacterium]
MTSVNFIKNDFGSWFNKPFQIFSEIRENISRIFGKVVQEDPSPVTRNIQFNAEVLNQEESQLQLFEACKKGNGEEILTAIEGGARLYKEDLEGQRPLDFICLYGHLDIAKLLLNESAVRSENSSTFTVLHYAVQSGCVELVKHLVDLGANINHQTKDGSTPLHGATDMENWFIFEALVKRGADLHIKNQMGETPVKLQSQALIYEAAKIGNMELCRFAHGNGADLTRERTDKLRPLDLACLHGHYDLVEYLVKHVSVNLPNSKNWTPLHYAYLSGNRDIIDLLIREGADTEAKNNERITPRLIGHGVGFFFIKWDEFTPYEKVLLSNKYLSHWLSMKGSVQFDNQEISLEGMPSSGLCMEVADSLKDFQKTDVFLKLEIEKKQISIIAEAFQEAFFANRATSEIIKKIQRGDLVFIRSGWDTHSITLSFINGYLAICNRGQGSVKSETIKVYKIDPRKITEEIIKEIERKSCASYEEGKYFVYERLPLQLSGETDELCTLFETISPSQQKTGNCVLASKTAALRFAWAMLRDDKPDAGTLIQARDESKMFTSFAAKRAMDLYFDKIPETNREVSLKALTQATKKAERFSEMSERLQSSS